MKFLDAEFVKGFIRMANDGWEQGWHERNGGNLSYRVKLEEVEEVKENFEAREWNPIGTAVPNLAGEYFLVTGSGKYFRNVTIKPEDSICMIELDEKGENYRIVWGLVNGGRPTSELPSHLMNLEVKKLQDERYRVVYHAHTTNVIALTFVLPLEDKVFTRELWEMATECPVVFPSGIGVVPWMVPGGREIAVATSELMKKYDLAIMGKEGCKNGVRIAAAHIDNPRLDLKPIPLYESSEMAYLKTHYYGGIKKYQWTAIPLAMHGVVVKSDGTVIKVCIGEEAGDPQFTITDILPHLGQDQATKPLGTAFTGEDLNILIGSRPVRDEEAKDAYKLNIMRLLNEKYGIVEADLISAEIEFVPAFKAVERNISADPSALSFKAAGESKYVTVTASGDYSVTSVPAGFTAVGTDDGLKVTAGVNSSGKAVSGTLVVSLDADSEKKVEIALSQAAADDEEGGA